METGFTCEEGWLTTTDVCTEICGDGLVFGNLPCDDGNLASGDGCNSACQVEEGYSCTGGTPTTPDVCSDICGDGINVSGSSTYCDDGNLDDGDGCSSTCSIEDGYECIEGNKY